MKNPCSLQNKVVIITGAGQGIGKALAHCAADLGASVALVDVNQAALNDVVSAIGADRAHALAGDVTDRDFVEHVVQQTETHFGDIHGLINNAGIVRVAMITEMPLADWAKVIDVNLTGAFLCLQAVGKHMVAKSKGGNPRPGAIVNVASDAGRRGSIGQINYGAAKSGVLGLTMCAAREWGRFHINVNSVCYGVVETDMTETVRGEQFRGKYLQSIPLGRFSSPEEIAPATCFLLSDAASYITGQHLGIDGGFHITS